MIKLNCWNEYDSLKTVILGKVYSNDKIPKLFDDENQEYYIKIINETNKELANFETILKQNNVQVLRPTEPENINGQINNQTDPLINMRDFHMVYGDKFFITYGPYKERRFNGLWLEDLTNQIINDNNLVISANELNLQNNILENYENEVENLENYFYIKYRKRLKIKNKKTFFDLVQSLSDKTSEDWFFLHNFLNSNKNTFHTASILKMNNICFMSKFSGSETGKTWMKNWLKTLNVTPIELPQIGHIDGSCTIVNKDTVITKSYLKFFDPYFKNHYYVDMDEEKYNYYSLIAGNELFTPKPYYEKWQPLFSSLINSTNGLTVKPNVVLLSYYNKDFYQKLKNNGIEAIYVKWSHSKFWEGNIHCITLDIERRPE